MLIIRIDERRLQISVCCGYSFKHSRAIIGTPGNINVAVCSVLARGETSTTSGVGILAFNAWRIPLMVSVVSSNCRYTFSPYILPTTLCSASPWRIPMTFFWSALNLCIWTTTNRLNTLCRCQLKYNFLLHRFAFFLYDDIFTSYIVFGTSEYHIEGTF